MKHADGAKTQHSAHADSFFIHFFIHFFACPQGCVAKNVPMGTEMRFAAEMTFAAADTVCPKQVELFSRNADFIPTCTTTA